KNRLGDQFSLEEIEDFVNQLERIDEAFRKSK
ncbi:MarR family transcriptional regulator, partial [Mesorhizobium sp. M8A.F.Ca.ET.202.01.1.1]